MRDTDRDSDEIRLAGEVAVALRQRDTTSQALGIEIEEIGPGYARMSMKVRSEMVNGYGTCHGGMMFTLADTTLAYASNSRNQATVVAGASIEFLAPVPCGMVLTAEARELAVAGRRGVYEVLVTDEQGLVVATVCGKSARLKGPAIGSDPVL